MNASLKVFCHWKGTASGDVRNYFFFLCGGCSWSGIRGVGGLKPQWSSTIVSCNNSLVFFLKCNINKSDYSRTCIKWHRIKQSPSVEWLWSPFAKSQRDFFCCLDLFVTHELLLRYNNFRCFNIFANHENAGNELRFVFEVKRLIWSALEIEFFELYFPPLYF